MNATDFKAGDWVIYRKQKSSKSPGPRAKEVRAASSGETYQYLVDKFWVVDSIQDDSISLRTRRGKRNTVSFDDPRLRVPNWWEKLIYRHRFREVERENQENGMAASKG